jgi:hypothetical protein
MDGESLRPPPGESKAKLTGATLGHPVVQRFEKTSA